MKSINFMFFFAVFLTVSCTNNDSQSIGNTILMKKLTLTSYDGSPNPSVTEEVFNYENNVLMNTVSETIGSGSTFTSKYQYNGIKITKVEYFQNDDSTPTSSRTLTYEGDDLKDILDSNGSSKQEMIYSQGKLSRQNLYFSAVNENNPINLGEQYNYTFNNGNISQQTYQSFAGFITQFTTTYQYDSKNNLMKNMNPYLKFFYIGQGFNPFTKNNIIASADTYLGSSTSTEYLYDITYNADNYPIKIIKSYKESQAVILVVDVEYL